MMLTILLFLCALGGVILTVFVFVAYLLDRKPY